MLNNEINIITNQNKVLHFDNQLLQDLKIENQFLIEKILKYCELNSLNS